MKILRNLWDAITRKGVQVGDPVWWAPKFARCVVTEVNSDGSFVFQGGPVVTNSRGREVPRWTVAATQKGIKWNELGFWQVGEGQLPKMGKDHQIVYPDPVALSGRGVGSFAVENK